MALSFVKYTADGVTKTYPITFGYIDKSHIHATVDHSAKDIVVDDVNNTVTFAEPPQAGLKIYINRFTPRNRTYSDFRRGNRFGEENVNNSFTWILYISQEIAEGTFNPDFQLASGDLNMGGSRITNIGAPRDDFDAVRHIDMKNYEGTKGPRGDKGDRGEQGVPGVDGKQGAQGVQGPQGPIGPTPDHQWDGPRLRFQQGDGTWGNWENLQGPIGPQGVEGVQGVMGPEGPSGADGKSFSPDAVGTLADKPSYDGRPAGFSFLAMDYEIGSGSLDDLLTTIDGQKVYESKVFSSMKPQNMAVFIGGSYQRPSSYTLSGHTITFKVAPPANLPLVLRRYQVDLGTGALFIKRSATSGDWFEPLAFGRGPRGDRGERGVQGVKGPQGERGLQGDRGPQGQKGPQGDIGLVGPQGPEGKPGVQGLKGEQGVQGNQGPRGDQGPRGERGEKGPQGDKGLRGDTGQRGSRAFYEQVNAASWNQQLVDSFFGPTGQYPTPVEFDQFIQYNPTAGYSETRVFRHSLWQTNPVNLVQNSINMIANGVPSTKVQAGAVTKTSVVGLDWVPAGKYQLKVRNITLVDRANPPVSGKAEGYVTLGIRIIKSGFQSIALEFKYNDGTPHMGSYSVFLGAGNYTAGQVIPVTDIHFTLPFQSGVRLAGVTGLDVFAIGPSGNIGFEFIASAQTRHVNMLTLES